METMAPQSYSIVDAISHKENVKKKMKNTTENTVGRRKLNNAKGEISATIIKKTEPYQINQQNREADGQFSWKWNSPSQTHRKEKLKNKVSKPGEK